MWTAIKQYFLNIELLFLLPSLLLQRLVSYVAFAPHRPSYTSRMEIHRNNGISHKVLEIDLNRTAEKMLFTEKYNRYKKLLRLGQMFGGFQFFYTYTSRGNRLFCLSMIPNEYENQKSQKFTIVYSHPNACDVGVILGSLWDLCDRCNTNLFAYDYSGYGRSTGKASERNLYADIEAVVKTLIYIYKIDPKLMILFGESIGSVPTIDMAARMTFGGVILQCPLMSGLRVWYNYSGATLPFDPFPNIEKVDKIECPVLVIHGTEDTIIGIDHGIALYNRCKHKWKPFWAFGRNHNNLRLSYKYFDRIKEFVVGLETNKNCNK